MEKHPLFLINNGLHIVTAKKDDRYNGLILHAAFQIHIEEPAVVIAVNRKNLTHEYIRASRTFTLSILEKETSMSLIQLFGFRSGREINKFDEVEYALGKSGLPYILNNTLAYVEAHVIHAFDMAATTLFVGRVINSDL